MAVAKNKAQQPAAAQRPSDKADDTKATAAPSRRSRQERGTRRLPRHAADPPLRGEGRPDVRHGPDRRLLPPLHRPGGRGGRHADGAQKGRCHHHRLPRPRPHAGGRHGRQGRHGGTDRPHPRLFQGQGRLDAHVLRREGLLRRPRHRRGAGAARHRPRLRQQVPRQGQCLADLFRRRRRQPGPGLRKLQHGEALDRCRRSTSSRTTNTPWALRSSARRRRSISTIAARPTAFRASRSTAWTCAR